MSRIIAYKEPTWLDDIADNGMWHSICGGYLMDYEMFEPNTHGTPEIAKDEVVVIFDEQGVTELEDFVHPENCVYIFGRTHVNDLLETIPHQHSVKIDYPGSKSMFGVSAVAIMLEDRKRKLA